MAPLKPGNDLRNLRLQPNAIRTATEVPATFDVEALAHWVDRDSHEMRKDLRQFLNDELFVGRYHDTLPEMRALALRRLKKLCETPGRFVSVKDFETDPRRIFACHEITCQVDGSFATKLTVQFNLFGGTVLKLGTDRHHDVLSKIDAVQEIGSFALTELGYGNNAMKLETTATYDEKTGEFVIHTPTPLAQKYWITNGAIDAHWCVVFAQTYVKGKHEGVQAFLVRVRDADLKVSKGCTIEDMGRKLGQNGVDNAKLGFNQVRIPREAMLNRVANVDQAGNLVSKITSPRGRFIAALNQLLSGRLCLSSKGVGRAKQALTIAVRYAATRLCVGASGESDTPILAYQLQQRALIPLIARTYAISVVGMTYVKNLFASETTANGSRGLGPLRPETEVLCSGIKSLNCWHAKQTVLVCRERSGGQGFLAANKFEEMIGDALAIETAEGDSSVLMMKVAKERLAWAEKTPYLVNDFTGFRDLLNSDYLLFLFRKREQVLIADLQGRMDRDQRVMGMSMFETWQMRVSDQVQHLAKAFVERHCLEQFLLEAKQNQKISVVLERLAILFAVDVIHTELGWFLSTGLLTLSEGSRVPEVLRDLCGNSSSVGIADWAVHLVKAFSIPEHLLPPAARDWVQYNEVNNQGELLQVKF
ncbi:hypothetical protein BASA81_007747 [Batrachochytrium salamandrivorans]|nr:hypothetical protein BASA81_007747 [Batrachochytrium salamandrivorans]